MEDRRPGLWDSKCHSHCPRWSQHKGPADPDHLPFPVNLPPNRVTLLPETLLSSAPSPPGSPASLSSKAVGPGGKVVHLSASPIRESSRDRSLQGGKSLRFGLIMTQVQILLFLLTIYMPFWKFLNLYVFTCKMMLTPI